MYQISHSFFPAGSEIKQQIAYLTINPTTKASRYFLIYKNEGHFVTVLNDLFSGALHDLQP